MGKRPALSKAETEVVRIVWTLAKATVREVYEALPGKRRRSFSTVQTYLSRLEKKGYLRVRMQSRVKVYSTRARPSQVVQESVEEFTNRLFNGQTMLLIKHLIDTGGLTRAQYQELGALCDKCDKLRQLLDPREAGNDGT